MVNINERSQWNSTKNKRKDFIRVFLPYLKMMEDGLIDIWYIDESSFNVNKHVKYGWSLKGKSPYVSVPVKSSNLSLLAAISINQKVYYQIFEGGIDA